MRIAFWQQMLPRVWNANGTFVAKGAFMVKNWCENSTFMVKTWCECGENGFGIDFVSFLCEDDCMW